MYACLNAGKRRHNMTCVCLINKTFRYSLGTNSKFYDVDLQDIQDLLDSSTEGVIVFSLGSLTRLSTFPPEIILSLLSAFSELPYKVLMKYEEDLPNTPTNVHVRKWLQQRDIIGR